MTKCEAFRRVYVGGVSFLAHCDGHATVVEPADRPQHLATVLDHGGTKVTVTWQE